MHIQRYMLSFGCLLLFSFCIQGSHFRGGIVSWRALNTTPSGTNIPVLIRQRYSWRRSFWPFSMCTAATIASQTIIGSGTGSLTCPVGTGCAGYTTLTTDTPCTDFSVSTDFSSGERYDTLSLTINRTYVLSYWNNAWFALAIGGGSDWQMTGKIDLTVRPDGKLNTSPVTSTLPIIYKQISIQHVHIVQMADADATDTLKCRWSTATGNNNGFNECRSVCAPSLPPTPTLIQDNCTLVFTLTAANYYAVALQIEDFYTSSSSTPMSSVPIQFLFYGRPSPGGSCSTAPSIIGVRPNLACLGVPIGVFLNETVIAQVGCSGKNISDFTTSSPVGMSKTNIINTSPGIYVINLLWTPSASQYGPQGFCAGAVDSTGVQSVPWCITFLVGFTAPNLQPPILVQGSASPIGTVLANHSIFSIQSVNGVGVNRPGRNGTYVHFIDATMNNTEVLSYDCGWSPMVTYSGNTIIIYAPYTWTYGHQYYVTFDSGASSGTEFCRAESAPITDPKFWVFDIWDPGLSSTVPPTTTTQTTATTTTSTSSTSTTTTVTTTTTTSTTSVTTSSTSATTTTTSVTTASTTVTVTVSLPDVNVMSPKDFMKACEQPVAIGTAISMIAMLPVHAIGLFTLFTKVNKMFNPSHIAAKQRDARKLKSLLS